MPIQAFMDPSEWLIFKERLQDISSSFSDIIGVLAVGSLVQSFLPPSDFYDNRHPTPLGIAYESIRNPGRRKVFPANSSDLDIWVCTRDTSASANSELIVERGGIALLEELAVGILERPGQQWSRKKESTFSEYYKKPDLYPTLFKSVNEKDRPWNAARFKEILESDILITLPDFVERIGRFTEKTIPGDFVQVRAFPESLFNLRPDESILDDAFEDRQPFPRIADDQWISPQHTSVVLYKTDETTIYPFRQGGRVLGQAIKERISNSPESQNTHSYGAVLIKPDALDGKQVEIIKHKILGGLEPWCGKIVTEKIFNGLNALQVEEIYPLLSGQDLQDTTRYLSSGELLVLVVEAKLSDADMVVELSRIKGPRVADRTDTRLLEGRVLNGSIRDLLPLPRDIDEYTTLLPTLAKRRLDPNHRFTRSEYSYYFKNLVHTPDNSLELQGLLSVAGYDAQVELSSSSLHN